MNLARILEFGLCLTFALLTASSAAAAPDLGDGLCCLVQ